MNSPRRPRSGCSTRAAAHSTHSLGNFARAGQPTWHRAKRQRNDKILEFRPQNSENLATLRKRMACVGHSRIRRLPNRELLNRTLIWAYLHETQDSYALERRRRKTRRTFIRLLRQAHAAGEGDLNSPSSVPTRSFASACHAQRGIRIEYGARSTGGRAAQRDELPRSFRRGAQTDRRPIGPAWFDAGNAGVDRAEQRRCDLR